jgi:tripartite-type tricarboxylate transporter receptor subunit TctC
LNTDPENRTMNSFQSKRAAALALALLCAVPHSAVAAQAFPERPVRIIVPFAPGGPTDVMARALGAKLAGLWGQSVLTDNRPGASANIGIGVAARATPDGHSLLLTTHAIVVNPSLHAGLPWNPLRDFVAITNTATAPNLLIAHPGLAAKSVKELVSLVRANPGKFNFGTPGAATSSHLTMEWLRITTGIDLQHVPYGGAGPVVNAVIANQVPVAVVSQAGAAVQMIKAGRIRALAATGPRRTPALPDVPTLEESGFPFVAESMNGLFAPAGTPAPVAARIHAEVVRVLQMSDLRSQLSALGFEPVGNSSEAFAAYVKSEIVKWSRVIRDAGIKAD